MPAVNSGRSVIDFAAAILERIHFLRDDVGGLADGAGEHRRMLDRRHFDPLEAVQTAHAVERRDHRGEAVGVFSKQALRAPNGLNWRHCRALKHKFPANGGIRRPRRDRAAAVAAAVRAGTCWRNQCGRRQEQLAEADHDRPAERIEQVRADN